jgi:hypothetical protein
MTTRTRIVRAIGAALLAAPLALAAAALPAGAGDDPLGGICGTSPQSGDADGAVGPVLTVPIGTEIWNLTGEDQSVGAALAPGGVAKFNVLYFNDDDVPRDIVVRGDLDGAIPPPGFVIKVMRSTNSKDVTNKVFGLSGLRFRDVSVFDDTAPLIVRIKMQPTANSNDFVEAFFTGNYEFASVCGDTLRISAGAP